MKRYGLIARATNKGLGQQTLEFSRHLPFAATLLVLDNNPQVRQHPEWYPDAYVVNWDVASHKFQEWLQVEEFLKHVDVVFSVETMYDWDIIPLCHRQRKTTIIQGNPEFYVHHRRPELPQPTAWTWPTMWRLSELPPGPVIPVPAPVGWAKPGGLDEEILTVVHPGGHRAVGDRNGTETMVEMLRYFRGPATFRIYGLDGQLPEVPRLDSGVHVELYPDGVADRWSMYDGAHVMVMPRRYGGLCLPVLEALSVGLGVVMPDCSPNDDTWPVQTTRAGLGRAQRTPTGLIPTAATDPRVLADTLRRLMDSGDLKVLRQRAAEWTAHHTWDVLAHRYIDLFEETKL